MVLQWNWQPVKCIDARPGVYTTSEFPLVIGNRSKKAWSIEQGAKSKGQIEPY
jgi:hypothetical protein